MATGDGPVVTLDTNVAVYALASAPKADAAARVLRRCSFLSVQVLNEYAYVGRRKRGDAWEVIAHDLAVLRDAVPRILPIEDSANRDAIRIAARYRLSLYDAVMLAVALAGQARTIYSEDMHDGLEIDGALRVVNPFRHDLVEPGRP